MRAFIFDKYGYYEDDEFASEFDYQGWHFKLEKTDRNEEELEELNEYVKRLNAYCKVEMVEVGDEPIPDNASENVENIIKDKEPNMVSYTMEG